MGKTLRFKDKEAYRKWVAYGNIHGVFAAVPGNQRVMIRGRKHKVKHAKY